MPNFPFYSSHKLIYYSLIFIIFVIPLVGFQPNLGYEGAKVFYFYLGIFVCAVLWFILTFKKPPEIPKSSIFKFSSLFLLSLLVTSLLGIDPKSSFIGKYPYYQGLILYVFLFFFYILISSLRVKLKDVAIALSASSATVSILAIKQFIELHFLDINIPTYAGRVVSTFGQPNLYSGFIMLTLPFLYLFFKNPKLRWWVIGSGIVSVIAILVSQSRSAILVTGFLLLGWVAYILRMTKKTVIILIATVFFVTLFASAYLSSGIIWDELQAPLNNQWLIENSPEKRIYVWQIIGQLILDRPILGYGLENIQPAYSGYFGKFNINTLNDPSFHTLKNLVVDRSHSYFLDLLMFSGILGFLVWILLIWQLFRKVKSKVLLVSLIIYLVWIQLQIQSVAHLMYFWLLVGLVDQENS